MREVEIGEHRYRVGQLSPMRQYNIIKRVMPVLTAISDLSELLDAEAAVEASEGEETGTAGDAARTMERLLKTAAPVISALGRMSDEDSTYVIMNTLRAVERAHATGWARVVTNDRSGEPLLMFEDLDLPTMMQLVWQVMQENLSRFFPTATPLSSVAVFPMARTS